MKRLLIVVCSLMILMMPKFCHAQAMADYEEAYKIFIAAGVSAATYNNRIGELGKGYLRQDGWEIDRYAQERGHAGARYLLAKKSLGGGQEVYVLAFVGTETTGDINFDLKVDKIYFAGHSIEEFKTNATRKKVTAAEPKVHRGFTEFLDSGLTAKSLGASGSPLLLTDILLKNKDAKLYLVGHSLGGAAATLAGAGLVNMGVNKGQLEVITFGAPAVGNSAFAAQFDPVLKLTRIVISGDPVTGIIQSLFGGYKQFGEETRWKIRDNSDQPHRITEYMDLALKNYYDKREQAELAGIQIPSPVAIRHVDGQQVYIAHLKNRLPGTLDKEFWYMRQALWDEYRQKLPGCMITKDNKEIVDWRKTAATAGYRWVVVPEVSVTKVDQERNISYINFSQTVIEVATGAIVEVANFSTGTYNLTPLEAFIHDFKGVNHGHSAWISGVK